MQHPMDPYFAPPEGRIFSCFPEAEARESRELPNRAPMHEPSNGYFPNLIVVDGRGHSVMATGAKWF